MPKAFATAFREKKDFSKNAQFYTRYCVFQKIKRNILTSTTIYGIIVHTVPAEHLFQLNRRRLIMVEPFSFSRVFLAYLLDFSLRADALRKF